MTTGTDGPTTSAVATWTRTYHASPGQRIARLVQPHRRRRPDSTGPGILGADGNSKFGIAGGQPIPGLSGITLGGGLTGIGAGAASRIPGRTTTRRRPISPTRLLPTC